MNMLRGSRYEHRHCHGEHNRGKGSISRSSISEAVPHFERFFYCLFIHSLFHIGRLIDVDGSSTASSVHEVFKLAAVLRLSLELLVVLKELEKSASLLVFREVVKRALEVIEIKLRVHDQNKL